MHGPAATGKTTFIEAVNSVMGDYAATADFETFLAKKTGGGPRDDIARLAGARFVASVEVSDGRKLAQGLVKMLTGGDRVAARHLYQSVFEFRPQFKLWLAANHAPRVADDDDAMWRRIIRIPFEHVIPAEGRKPEIKAALRSDPAVRAAVLRWAVGGVLAWRQVGLRVPGAIQTATAAYREDMDPLRDFFADCCTFGSVQWASRVTLRKAYADYCADNGIRHPVGPKQFHDRLRGKGCEESKRGADRGWSGVGLQAGLF